MTMHIVCFLCGFFKFLHLLNLVFEKIIFLFSHLVDLNCEVFPSSFLLVDPLCTQGLWDVRRDGDESKQCCSLCVYVNVAFVKKTMFRGLLFPSLLYSPFEIVMHDACIANILGEGNSLSLIA